MGRGSSRRGPQAGSGSAALGPAPGTTDARCATSCTGHAARAARGDLAPLTQCLSGGRRCAVRFLPAGLSRRALLGAARSLAPHRRGKRHQSSQSRHARSRDPLRARRQSCARPLRGALVGPLPLPPTRDAAHGAERARLRARECSQAPGAAGSRSVLLGALVRRLCGGATRDAWRSADASAPDLALASRLAAAWADRPRRRTAARPPKIVVDLTASRPRTDDGSEHAPNTTAPARRSPARAERGIKVRPGA
jgi:hypothetical protein